MKKYLIAIALLAAAPAHAITYVVDGTFPEFGSPATPSSYLPVRHLGGTIEIVGGRITAVDFIVTDAPTHFTDILFNQASQTEWLISAYNNGRYADPAGRDYITLNFNPVPGPYLIGFEQGRITGGAAVNQYDNPITTISTTTYYGFSPTGTICPVDGCAPFPIPPVFVPGPVVGAGLPGIIGLLGLWWGARRYK